MLTDNLCKTVKEDLPKQAVVNICHITSAHMRYDIRIFIKECITLKKAGYLVNLIVADDFSSEVKDGVHIWSVGKEVNRYWRLLKTPQKIYHKVLALNPDIIHFHDPELMLVALKLRKKGYKVVYDVHEDLPKQVRAKHWLPVVIRPLVSLMVSILEKYISSRLSAVITATPLIANRFMQYNQHTVFVCNYPLLSELSNIDTKWSEREDSLCYIGSISKTRGIEYLVRSLAISKYPLQLAGSFSDEVDPLSLNLLEGYNYINYLGILDRSQINHLLSKVKVGVVTLLATPSYVESLPIKMFEYMLAGIPVVASNFELWQQIVTKYNCGLLVKSDDITQIAKACTYLIEHPEDAENMGKNGRYAVLNYFNWEHESLKLLTLYNQLI